MSESKELVPVRAQQEMSLEETLVLGNVLAQSGYFSDAGQKAQAVVKILAGREYGFGPIASMTGIYLVNGKITLGADMLAKAVKRHPHYDYQVVKLEADECILEFFRNGERIGTSGLTMQQARDAKMNQSWDKRKSAWKEKIPWKNFPRNMLFARCISNGVKWFCPDAVGAVTYTPDEIGAETDERGDIVDVIPMPVPAAPPAEKTSAENATPAAQKPAQQAATKPANSWNGDTIMSIVEAKYAKDGRNAVKMLALSQIITPLDDKDRLIKWASLYRAARGEEGATPKSAALSADNSFLDWEAAADGGNSESIPEVQDA